MRFGTDPFIFLFCTTVLVVLNEVSKQFTEWKMGRLGSAHPHWIQLVLNTGRFSLGFLSADNEYMSAMPSFDCWNEISKC